MTQLNAPVAAVENFTGAGESILSVQPPKAAKDAGRSRSIPASRAKDPMSK